MDQIDLLSHIKHSFYFFCLSALAAVIKVLIQIYRITVIGHLMAAAPVLHSQGLKTWVDLPSR